MDLARARGRSTSARVRTAEVRGRPKTDTTARSHSCHHPSLLAVRSLKLPRSFGDARKAGHAYLVIDGTSIPGDRLAEDLQFYSRRHRKWDESHVIARPDGDMMGPRFCCPASSMT